MDAGYPYLGSTVAPEMYVTSLIVTVTRLKGLAGVLGLSPSLGTCMLELVG